MASRELVTKQQHNNHNLSIYVFNDILIICLVKPVVRGRIETQSIWIPIEVFSQNILLYLPFMNSPHIIWQLREALVI